MQFVLVIYQGATPLPTNPEAWATLSEEEQKAIYQDYNSLNNTPGVTPGLPLGLPEDAITVQVLDGKTVTRKGPNLSEGAGGYLVLEADDLDKAVELATRIPRRVTAERSKSALSLRIGRSEQHAAEFAGGGLSQTCSLVRFAHGCHKASGTDLSSQRSRGLTEPLPAIGIHRA